MRELANHIGDLISGVAFLEKKTCTWSAERIERVSDSLGEALDNLVEARILVDTYYPPERESNERQ